MTRPALVLLLACGGGEPDGERGRTTPPEPLVADAGDDVAGVVGTPITFDGSASIGTELSWDFGDGTTASGAVVEHTYARAGNYTAVLLATASDGSFETDVAVAVAYNPPLGPSHTSSWMAVDSEGRAYTAFPEAGVLTRIEDGVPEHRSLCGEIRGVALADGEVGVACDDRLIVLGAVGLTELWSADFDPGEQPWNVSHDGDGWILTLQGTGQVTRISGPTQRELVAELPDARGLTVGTTGIWAARYRSIDGQGRIDGTTAVALPHDPGPDSDTTVRGTPTALEHLLLSPDEGWLYASGVLANVDRGQYVDGQIPGFDTSVRAFLDAVDPATGEQRWRKQFDDHGMAGPLALSPLGNWLFVGFPTTGDVLILDAYTGDIVSSILGAGQGIRALHVYGDQLYVYAWLDRAVHTFDVSDLGSPVRIGSAEVGDSEPLDPDVLLGKQIFWNAADTRMGKAGYLSCAVCHPDGEHDGQTWDFTDRGEGMRNTTSLLGRAGTGMGPLHWTANFDEVQDFEHDIRGPFGGSGFLDDADWDSGTTSDTLGDPKAGLSVDLDALAAYVTSLDTPPVSPGPGNATGQALFASLGCDSCHPAPLYTDSPTGVRHDIGTLSIASGSRLGGPLDGLDTPTLLGAWQTPPYLHDGSAPTLADAIAAHPSAATLDPSELADLAAFVSSL